MMAPTPNQVIKNLVNSGELERTMVGRIRELLPEIEHAQRQGVRLKMIVGALKGADFPDMNLKCLQNLLYQARRRKGMQPQDSKVKPGNVVQISGQPATTEYPTLQGNGGIDIERIMNAASTAAKQTKISETTLALLRNSKNN